MKYDQDQETIDFVFSFEFEIVISGSGYQVKKSQLYWEKLKKFRNEK
jgi:hypothetical protein